MFLPETTELGLKQLNKCLRDLAIKLVTRPCEEESPRGFYIRGTVFTDHALDFSLVMVLRRPAGGGQRCDLLKTRSSYLHSAVTRRSRGLIRNDKCELTQHALPI